MTTSTTRTTYRHGDLRNALLTAGVDLARAGGPDAVVLREATRRAGVAPNAAYRHFADRTALLHAVASVGRSQLAVTMETEQTGVPAGLDAREGAWARLHAAGVGYLRYAQDEPGLCRTAFAARDNSIDLDDADGAGHSGLTAFQQLGCALDELVATGAIPAQRRPDAELVAWAAVHGLALLLIDGPLRRLDRAHADRLGDHLIAVVRSGL